MKYNNKYGLFKAFDYIVVDMRWIKVLTKYGVFGILINHDQFVKYFKPGALGAEKENIMNICQRHFRKHQARLRRQRDLAEHEARREQSQRDRIQAHFVDPLKDLRAALEPAMSAEAHECQCSARCEVCACVPPHAAAEEELQEFANAEVERVLNDGNAKEHLAAAKAYVAPIQLSFWQRFKLWFAELVAPACSYREGGVNYHPPVKQQ